MIRPSTGPLPHDPRRRLRLISYNIQAGASTARYREYLTGSWQHVLPHPNKRRNLNAVAELVTAFDIVALQEADGGSLRSGFNNQVQYLAELAQFPWWSHQANRNVAALAASSNGLLSRVEPSEVVDHKLPGAIPGRGALAVRYGTPRQGLLVVIAHLALTRNARRKQCHYLAELIGEISANLAGRAQRGGVALHTALTPPLIVSGDRDRLKQALLNLLDNALRATPPGGRIAVTARPAERGVVIDVVDSGPGIPPDLREAVWERGIRGADGGSGLGLAIVRTIVEAHGGSAILLPAAAGAHFQLTVPGE